VPLPIHHPPRPCLCGPALALALPVAARASTIDFPRQGVVLRLPARGVHRPRCFLWRSPANFSALRRGELSSHSVGQQALESVKVEAMEMSAICAKQTCWDAGPGRQERQQSAQAATVSAATESPGENQRLASQCRQGSRSCEASPGQPCFSTAPASSIAPKRPMDRLHT